MSRFEIGGYGPPIPDSADIGELDPHIHPVLPIQSLVLVNGDTFHKVDWTTLGYTHYEVWCVGGAGGQGGDAGRKLLWPYRLTFGFEIMPSNVFTAWKEGYLYQPQGDYSRLYATDAQYRAHYYPIGYWPASSPTFIITGYLTFDQYANWMASFIDWPETKPSMAMAAQTAPHKGRRRYLDPPILIDDGAAIGGGGGGGGVHRVSGALADLPDAVPVTVGKAGAAKAPVGHLLFNGPFTPSSRTQLTEVMQDRGDWGQRTNPQLWEATYRGWSDVQPAGAMPTFLPPQAGQDGGASSFGSICRASGGKGGGPSVSWIAGKLNFLAYGGDGGKGGQLTAGGGALGSHSSEKELWPTEGKSGTWDGTIGTGGGGGRGGGSAQPYPFMYTIVPEHATDTHFYYVHEQISVFGQGWPVIVNRNASAGGYGAMSKLDTSVFTEGGPRRSMTKRIEYGGSLAHSAGAGAGQAILPTLPDPPILEMFPGSGGGARVNRKYYVGSYRSIMDARYSPDGIVLLRLIKRGDD